MAMILDAVMNKCSTLLVEAAFEEATMVLGVKDEVQKLLLKMESIRSLLEDAEKKKINDSSIKLWLSQLKDVMYDADDIIDLCKIKGKQLLADDENSENDIFRVCCNLSSTLSSFVSSVTLRRGIGKSMKDLNVRLQQIDENRKQFNLQRSEVLESPQITLVNPRQSGPLADPLVVGEEVEVAANELVNLLITGEVIEERCRIFAVAGMGGIGKTTLAQKIYNHPRMENYFNLIKIWVTVSQTYSEIELLKQVIRGAKGNCGDANSTKEELQLILRDSVASGQSLFLVLDDVWRADVWDKLLRVPLQTANASVRVLVTTRNEAVAKAMKPAYTHNVEKLSTESSWDMLRKLVFSDGEEQLWDELKELGFVIVKRCGGLPLAIKAIAGVLNTRERTKIEWENILRSDAWSVRDLHADHIAALQLSFEDLPSHLKQCFLYFSLYGEDAYLYSSTFPRLWVAEGFIPDNCNEGSLMEDAAEQYFNELLGRNLLLMSTYAHLFPMKNTVVCTMHDLVRSLVIFLSKEETSYGGANVRNSTASTKLRRLSTEETNATEIFDLVAKQGALRTLLASNSDLLLDKEKLKWLSCLRVLDISFTKIKELPVSIGDLVHLRYLDVSRTEITTVPDSIVNLSYLQFLNIFACRELTQLPNGITQLHNLRYLNMNCTSIRFMPKGIQKLQQLNYLKGFQTDNNDASSKLDDLISLNQLRTLSISNLKGAHTEEIILKELPHLSMLTLEFISGIDFIDLSREPNLAVEELFDKIIPPRSLKGLYINNFHGRRFPNWMSSASFGNYVPNLTELELYQILSCAQLPPLGQLPELKKLRISHVDKVKKIGLEFLGSDINSTINIAIAFPKLETLEIIGMYKLEEWFFGVQVEDSASQRLIILPCLHKLIIRHCPLLKSLDHIRFVKELELYDLKCLERICGFSMLKELSISECRALSYVEKLDSLQKLKFNDIYVESLPDWLLMILRQHGLQNKYFALDLTCQKKVFQACLEGGSYWELIQQISIVTARDKYGPKGSYLCYNKHPYVYDIKIYDDDD